MNKTLSYNIKGLIQIKCHLLLSLFNESMQFVLNTLKSCFQNPIVNFNYKIHKNYYLNDRNNC